LGVSDGAQYDATQRLPVAAAKGRRRSRRRAHIAEGISGGQEPLGLTGGQARAERAQRQPMGWCLVAFWIRERERYAWNRSSYKLKRPLSCHGRRLARPALERLTHTA
jgi:hypothetical protein